MYFMATTKPSFNTQPPEGGWEIGRPDAYLQPRFNTQPPEGGWIVFQQTVVQI